MPIVNEPGYDITFCEQCQSVWQFALRGNTPQTWKSEKYPNLTSFKLPRGTCPECKEETKLLTKT